MAMMLSAAGAPGLLVLGLALLGLGAGTYAVLLLARTLVHDRRLRARAGPEALVGHVGVLRGAPAPQCRVFVDGALWRAEPDWQHADAEHAALHSGDRVVVERVHGLTLCVRKAEDWELVR
jgi:membrane-bound serine protease (ClpP class)